MKETIEQQLGKVAGRIQLGTDEKALMRERLVAYMEHKPIRSPQRSPRPSSIPLFTFFRAHHFSGALTVALLATVSTFGVSSAADDALPGDLLYPVKVNINEEIKTVLLGSDEEELLWESKRAELRLMEASQLAAEGRLDVERQEEVSKLLAEHTEAVTEKVHAMEETDPALVVEVSTDLEAALGTHEAVLARLIVEQEGDESGATDGGRDLVEQVRTAARDTEKAREGAEQMLAGEPEVVVTGQETGNEPVVQEEQQPKATAPNANSANMRERAVYRAQERATESLARARELVMALDPESDLAKQSMSQLAAGEALVAEGTAALAEHELGTTYSLYRRADTIFQKVARLLEVLNLFSVEVLHDTVAEELPTVENNTDIVDSVANADISDGTSDVNAVREETEKILTETRNLLLTVDDLDEDVVTEVNSLIKDALAHGMRGEIALILAEHGDALKLFDRAHAQAERAFDVVSRAARELGVVNVVAPNVPTNTDPLPAFTLTHRYEDGAHVWMGTIDTPAPCAVLETGALVAESYPEQITLTLNITHPADAVCDQGISMRSFEIRAAASEEAHLAGVQVNGVSRTWAVTEEQ